MPAHHVGPAPRPGIIWIFPLIGVVILAAILVFALGMSGGTVTLPNVPSPQFSFLRTWANEAEEAWNAHFHPNRIINPGWTIPLALGEGSFEVGPGVPTGCIESPLSEVSFETSPRSAHPCVRTYGNCTGPTDGELVWQHGPPLRSFRVWNGCPGAVTIHTWTK